MIGAVVLAAGRGQRFGYAPKLLAQYGHDNDDTTLVAHTLRAVNRAAVRPVVIVTGRRHAAIADIGRREIRPAARLRIVRNRRYHKAMARSLQLGLHALPRRCDAALICLADMPAIDTRTIARLLAASHDGIDYVRPVCAGRPGHPVVVSRVLFGEIDALRGDRGAQPVLAGVPTARRRLISGPRGCITDIDTGRALRRARRADWQSAGVPFMPRTAESFMVTQD